MIYEIKITKSDKCVSWWGEAPALMEKKSIKFKDGLNIIWAPNGAGKSTLLTALARTLQCEESFTPVISRSSIESMYGFDITGENKPLKGIKVIHDGALCFSFNPEVEVGLSKGYMDDDYIKEVLLNKMNKYSSGTDVQDKMVKILENLRDDDFKVEYKIDRESVNSLWLERLEHIENILHGTKPSTGIRTLLLDEPCRSVDLPRQRQLWDVLKNYSTRYQIIVATHNPMALNIDEANYIDLEEGFMDECLRAI